MLPELFSKTKQSICGQGSICGQRRKNHPVKATQKPLEWKKYEGADVIEKAKLTGAGPSYEGSLWPHPPMGDPPK